MSKRPIDEKIVALKLDNSHFKKYALEATSMFEKMTDTFKDNKKLNLNNIVHSLADVGKAVTGVDFSPLIDGADDASGRFAALGVVAVSALSNLTNKLVDAGMAMVQSFTSDPIRAGFAEYELKMNATQTILASTGEELSVVNGYLDELNEYSDRTIYSFADMTNNIGKFTNAGVSLKDAVKAIQGVSNVAAVSGANTEEASRAMYNFSQALSQGHVKLIDWKSIENANMSTVEFKEQLLESAVAAGNLEKTADGMYRVLTTNGQGSTMDETIDATKNFNDSLAYQWMTTDALIGTLSDYADETTDIGKKAFKAAQEIKTFSQMVDTIKEGVESGWSRTFELIFGDYYTAIDLWTGLEQAISGFLSGGADRRNNFLQKFVDLGGREKIIQTVVNLYQTLLNLIKPITNGFKKMIPESSGKSWVLLASAIELVTRALRVISGPIGKTVGFVFTGLFAIIRGGIELVKFMGKLLAMLVPKNLGPNLKKLGSALSGLYSNIKDVFKVFSESSAVQGAIQTMITLIEKVGVKATEAFGMASVWLSDKFAKAIDYIIANLPYIEERLRDATVWVQNFADDATVFLKDFSVNAKLYFEELWVNLKGGWSNAKDWTQAFFETASNWMDILKEKFGESFTFLWDVVKTVWDFVTSISFADVFKAGTFTAILIYGKKIIKMFKEAKEKVMDFLGLGDGKSKGNKPFKLLDGLKDALENLEKSVNAGTLLAIAGSVLILVGAIKMLEGMDHADISKGLAVVVTGLIGLVGALKVMSGMSTGIFQSISTIALIGALSTSMVILAGALKIMASIDGDTLGRSLYALAATLTMLVAAIRLMTIPKGEMLASAGFVVGLSIAIRIMVGAIEDIGSMDIDQLKVGLVSMGVILMELAVFMRLASDTKINPASAVSLVITVGAVKLMVSEIRKIADMPADEIKKGLITLGIILLELGVFARLASGASVIGAGVGMIAVAYAIDILIPSIRELGNMDYKVLKQGLIGLAIGLAAISASMALAGVGGLGSGLGILAVAVAINALVPPIKALGAMDIKVLAIGIGAMAAALLVIGGTAYLLSAASVSLLAFGAGLFLVGSAFALVGVGMVGLSTGLAAFAAMSVASIYGLSKVFKALLDVVKTTIPDVVDTIMTMLEAILASIENHMPNLMQSGLNIIMSILEGIRNKIYAVTDVVLDIITAFVDAIADNVETVVKSAVNLIIKFVDGLANTIRTEGPRFTKAVMNLFESILEVVILASLDVLEILFHWIPGVSEALDKAGDSATSALREAFDVATVAEEGTDDFIGEVDKKRGKSKNSGSELAKELKAGMDEVDGYDTVGAEKTQDFVDGMDSKATIAGNKAKAIALDSKSSMAGVNGYNTVGASKVEQYTTGMGSKSSLANNKAKAIALDSKNSMAGVKLTTTGSDAGQQYVDGVSSRSSGARQSGVKLGTEVQNGANTVSLYNTGINLAKGLSQGLDNSIWSVSQKARELSHAVKYNIEGPMKIMSPSRVMIEDGMHIGQGLVIGLSRMIGKVASKARDVSFAVKDNITRYSEGLSDALNANIDMTPTITPVFDLSNMDLDMLDRLNVGSINLDREAVDTAVRGSEGGQAGTSVEYNIHITANGKVSKQQAKEVAEIVKGELKRDQDSYKFNRGEIVTA